VQAVPEQAAGLACGSAESAFQLLCMHPDGRDPCRRQRAATLRACPTCLAAISLRSSNPRSAPVGLGRPCCCSWLSSLQCLHLHVSACPLHHHHCVRRACGFIPSCLAYWDWFAHTCFTSQQTLSSFKQARYRLCCSHADIVGGPVQ